MIRIRPRVRPAPHTGDAHVSGSGLVACDGFVALGILELVYLFTVSLDRGASSTGGSTRTYESDSAREFTKLYCESYAMVYNYVRRAMGDNDAEDIVAEAYLHAARSFASFDPERAKFSTWVVKIASNCMASHYRREHQTVALEDVPESIIAIPGEQEKVGDVELAERLLALLDDREREITLMRYQQGLRNVDIAEVLDMNPSTVATILQRALLKMRASADSSEI